MGSHTDNASSINDDRRQHRRLAIHIPVECRRWEYVVRTMTQNISTGGMYLELDRPDFDVGDRIDLDFSLPATEGVSPYPGRGRCQAQVLRTIKLPVEERGSIPRFGIGARFLDRLRFSYEPDR